MHYKWVCQIGKVWLHPEEYFDSIPSRAKGDTSVTFVSTNTTITTATKGSKSRSIRVSSSENPKKFKFIGFTDATLSNNSKCFEHRLDLTKKHWPKPVNKGKIEPRCQLHTWATESTIRKKSGVVRCDTCKVHLFIPCLEIFHEERNLLSC